MRTTLLAATLAVLAPLGNSHASPTAQAVPQAPPAPEGFGEPFKVRPLADGPVKVGPAKGTVVVVGGGSMGPEIYKAFIDAAGGPDATILVVPNAGGADSVSPTTGQAWRNNGAKNIVVLFTKDRKVADSDSFATIIRNAGGVWFEGGRQFHLVQDYGGTKTEREFMALLERGGVVGGSSAGATILGDFMVQGAPSNNNAIMDYPGYQRAFGYLRGVGIAQMLEVGHVSQRDDDDAGAEGNDWTGSRRPDQSDVRGERSWGMRARGHRGDHRRRDHAVFRGS